MSRFKIILNTILYVLRQIIICVGVAIQTIGNRK